MNERDLIGSVVDGMVLKDSHLVWKDSRRGKKPQELDAYSRYCAIPGAPELSLPAFLRTAGEILDAQAEAAKRKTESFTIFQTAEDLIEVFLGFHKIAVEGAGTSFRIDGSPVSLADLKPLLGKFVEDYNREIPMDADGKKLLGKPYKVTHAWDAFLVYIHGENLDRHQAIRARIEYREIQGFDLEAEVDRLLEIIGVEGDLELFRAGFLHWLWQVKRYISGLPVAYHLMLSLFGGQGLGKTYLVRKLICKPLEDFYLESSLDAVSDPREVAKWTKFFVVNFEELSQARADGRSGLSDTAVSAFKSLLTSERLTIREMYSHKQVSHPRTFAAIATTNVQISKRLGDSSGMRRFLEMEVKADEPFHRRGVNQVEFLKIWRSVDEGKPEGYLNPERLELWARLSELQKTYIPEDTLDHWAKDGEVAPVPLEVWAETSPEARKKFRLVSVREAYEAYTDFVKAAGYSAQNLANFRERLKGKNVRIRKGTGASYSVYLRDNVAEVHEEDSQEDAE